MSSNNTEGTVGRSLDSPMIFIGNQTSCWASNPVEPFDYALARRFGAFEWFPDKKPDAGWDENDLDRGTRQSIRSLASDRGMRLSVHARWQANPLDADSYPLLWKDLELATDLGAALLNVHFFHEQGLEAFVQALLPLVRRTAEAGLQLSLENTPHHSPEQFSRLFALLRGIRSLDTSHVGMCLDLGHANLCAATRNDYLGFCNRLDPKVPVIHLHLHENWGDADTHLPLFTGPAATDDRGIRGFLAWLRRRRYSGSAIFEQWPDPPSLLDTARDRLLALWNVESGANTRPAQHQKEEKLRASLPRMGTGCGTGDFIDELVAGDERCQSWREKLDFARGLLARDAPALTTDRLIDVAIYLRFLGTGEIPCAEDGRHFRPAHHARISEEIQQRLADITTAENKWIIRKIYPWLPSSGQEFQRPEPLTRIRDIAHRNDIPQDLKREIKTALQNKLHRCAGPEDLATSSALLERITAPGADYSPAFVEQFRFFHEELREFFNAQSLDERLNALTAWVDREQAELIQSFRRLAHGRDFETRVRSPKEGRGRADDSAGLLEKLRLLTTLRRSLLDAAGQRAGHEVQELLLADIGLEDFAFVLLSEIFNACEANEKLMPDQGATTPHKARIWNSQVEASVLALDNLALSGVDPSECGAVQKELESWGDASASASREGLLRMKSTLMRCRRLAEDFSSRTVALFAGHLERLGRALGVERHAIRVFSESEIRSHNVFQLSKLAGSLLCRVRERLDLPGWDVVVGGRVEGRVRAVDSLDDLDRSLPDASGGTSTPKEGADGPWVVLLASAAGDEEVPMNVVAIILAQGIPHLSHLAVRARQAGIVFVSCEAMPEFERLRSVTGQTVSLLAEPDKVAWQITSSASGRPLQVRQPPKNCRLSSTQLGSAIVHPPPKAHVPLEETTPENGGGKAAGVRRLMELSRQSGANFRTPAGFVVPFGVMEQALSASPPASQEYRRLVRSLDSQLAAVQLPDEAVSITRRLRELVQSLDVPEPIVSEARRRFGQRSSLMVRSSASCEDLAEFAGAGLYESVGNVTPDTLVSAIRSVWASLWTRRAAFSRQQSGIPHNQARMAVLVQELLNPDFAFVLHTVNPVTRNPREVYAEIVVGLGETLASAATAGSPYRLVCDKETGAVTTLAFANFSHACRADPQGGLRRETIDYSDIDLSLEAAARAELGRQLTGVARFVENAMRMPQDIEGVVIRKELFLVQSRPQTGLA